MSAAHILFSNRPSLRNGKAGRSCATSPDSLFVADILASVIDNNKIIVKIMLTNKMLP
jgi:hypothetical protein